MATTIPLTKHVDELIRAYEKPILPPPPPDGVETVRVDKAMSRIAFVYEKVRNAVEYRETHLLRRAAIERILKRRLHARAPMEEIAAALMRELIRARYLPNATYPEATIKEVAQILSNYHQLQKSAMSQSKDARSIKRFTLELVASAVEEHLVPPLHVESLVAAAHETYSEVVEFIRSDISEADRDRHLYVATHFVLPKSAISTVRHRLFKLEYPEWSPEKEIDEKTIHQVASSLSKTREEMNTLFRHPTQERLQRQLRRHVAPFIVLRTLLEKHGPEAREIMQNPDQYEPAIRESANELYKTVKGRIRRSAVRAIIYLFLTKIVIGVLTEIPYDIYVIGEIDPIPLAINVLFPPFLVFLIALWIRLPGEGNTQRIIQRLWGVTYGAHGGDWQIRVRPRNKRRGVPAVFFFLTYMISILLVYGGSALLLRAFLGFNAASIGVFLMFLSLVSFFGYRIRQAVRELLLAVRREGVFAIVFDFLSIPILRVGRFLSINFSRMNVLAFILDVILESPFKTVVDFFEDWIAYMREKKEEIIEDVS